MKESTLNIRKAEEGDIIPLAVLMSALGYETTQEEMSERFSKIVQQSNYVTFVACYKENVIGMIGASYHYSYEQNGTHVRTLALVTMQTFRGIGIGRALLESVENWGKEIGAGCILLNCGNRPEREDAHQFYCRMGFREKSVGYVKWL